MSRNNYPHPVLGIGDNVLPALAEDSVVAKDYSNKYNYTFVIDLKLNNLEIMQLISMGSAEYVCQISCPDTFLNIIQRNDDGHFEFEIKRTSAKDRITISCFVVTKQPIPYCLTGFNPDYQNTVFNLQPGDVIVKFREIVYPINLSYESLSKPETFITITESKSKKDITLVNLEGDKIDIQLPSQLFRAYRSRVNKNKNSVEITSIHASIVMSALIYALKNIQEHSSRRWALAIYARMQNDSRLKDYSLENDDSIFEIAQIILGNPFKRMIDKFIEQ